MIYDLANTIFALGVVGLYFPDWMASRDIADGWLAMTEAIAGLVVVFLAPFIGARSDHRHRRIPALRTTTIIAVVATGLLTAGPLALTFIALGVALVAVNTGSVVYDALLPLVSTVRTRASVSGLGVGVGYIGSFIGLGIGVVVLDVLEWSHWATFVALGLGFAGFSVPTFLAIREPTRPAEHGDPPAATRVVGDLRRSWQRAATHPGVVRFLVSRFLYTDAINTLLGGFLTIFVQQELGLDRVESRNLLALAILAALVGGIAGGRITAAFGPVRTVRAMLVLWVIAIACGVTAAVADLRTIAWLIGLLGGFALGGTWAADRVVMLQVSPPRHLGEFYGLYATVGRFATILGPLVWVGVADGLGLGRVASLATLGALIVVGWVVLGGVDDRPRVWPEDLR